MTFPAIPNQQPHPPGIFYTIFLPAWKKKPATQESTNCPYNGLSLKFLQYNITIVLPPLKNTFLNNQKGPFLFYRLAQRQPSWCTSRWVESCVVGWLFSNSASPSPRKAPRKISPTDPFSRGFMAVELNSYKKVKDEKVCQSQSDSTGIWGIFF